MKYHPIFKGLAIFLAALAVVAGLASFAGIALVASEGLYNSTVEYWQQTQAHNNGHALAWPMLQRYTALKLGQCDPGILHYAGIPETKEELSDWQGVDPNSWDYTIQDATGNYLDGDYVEGISGSDGHTYIFQTTCDYPVDVTADELATFDDTNSPYRDYFVTETEEHYLYYFPSPEYTVTVRMKPVVAYRTYGLNLYQVTWLHANRNLFIVALAVSVLFFVLCLAYLCFAAGKSWKNGTITCKGLNRLPLDLYLGIAVLAAVGGAYLFFQVTDTWTMTNGYAHWDFWILSALAVFAAATVVVMFFYALAAQAKIKNRYWWRNSILGKLCKLIKRGFRFLLRMARKLWRLLPLIWQWVLIAAAMVIIPTVFLLLATDAYGIGEIFFALLCALSLLADVAIVLYGAYCFGILRQGAKEMAAGDLNAKVDTKYLFSAFRDFGDHLNALSDAAVTAAKKQMQSERMKTELITNVSHDIKTPLTSIINYVDLLEKPHTEEESAQYLDVLSRQSLRLKKLIDDLMEMSKASTGSMSVNITPLDLVESINQALGEFSDKLEKEKLQVVFRQPTHPIAIQADGRLTWRVLSNLLSNIVKYALSGTRVYLDVTRCQSTVVLSLKNISREELNVSADELTERFVRGDASRNTEGSGLGLNIAQSLMELQNGRLELLVDGDLFKVTLTFPAL